MTIDQAIIEYDISSFNITNNINKVLLTDDGVGWTTVSDKRLKTNIHPIENSLDKIKQVQGYYYNLIANPDKLHLGVIAQEVEKVMPEAISLVDNEHMGVNYTELIPVLINSVNELNDRVTTLEKQNETMMNFIQTFMLTKNT